MHKLRFSIGVAAVVVGSTLVAPLSGCSDSSEEQNVVEGPQTTVHDQQNTVEAPIIVDGPGPVSMKVGQAIDVTTENVTMVKASDNSVLEVSQPTSDGSATFNAGAVAKASGDATLTAYENEKKLYEVEVTVTD